VNDYDHIWYWTEKARPALGNRKDKRCRVLARGALNSVCVEFEEDGLRVITSRYAARRAKLRHKGDSSPPAAVSAVAQSQRKLPEGGRVRRRRASNSEGMPGLPARGFKWQDS
jgi:hypothetical protein